MSLLAGAVLPRLRRTHQFAAENAWKSGFSGPGTAQVGLQVFKLVMESTSMRSMGRAWPSSLGQASLTNDRIVATMLNGVLALRPSCVPWAVVKCMRESNLFPDMKQLASLTIRNVDVSTCAADKYAEASCSAKLLPLLPLAFAFKLHSFYLRTPLV